MFWGACKKKVLVTGTKKVNGEKKKMEKEKLMKWIDARIELSKGYLEKNGTTWEDVLNNNDTYNFGETGEDNNFEAGVISGLVELKAEMKKNE